MQLSISEILDKASKIKNKAEKVDWLKKNDSVAIKSLLKAMYDPTLKCLLPEGTPPYTPSQFPDDQGMLFTNIRRLPYFYEGKGSNVNPIKRETIFIELLESVNKDDAILLVDMKDKKRINGLTVKTINEAFPNLITEDSKSSDG
jgi:hypothetical protein